MTSQYMRGVSCERLYGGSCKVCHCRLPDGGWAECPPEARGILGPAIGFQADAVPRPQNATPPAASFLSGDICHACGSPQMTRAGTCLTCQDCGDTSGGCS